MNKKSLAAGNSVVATGRVWRVPAGIDTDALAPGRYMNLPIEQLAQHCLEQLRPDFASGVKPGDLLVAGKHFGVGSSREQAAQALQVLGVGAVLAPSFSGLFYRNAINLGVLVLVCPLAEQLNEGEIISLDLQHACVRRASGNNVTFDAMPEFLWKIIRSGGLMASLEQQSLARRKELL